MSDSPQRPSTMRRIARGAGAAAAIGARVLVERALAADEAAAERARARSSAAAKTGRLAGATSGFLIVSMHGWLALFRRIRAVRPIAGVRRLYLTNLGNVLVAFGLSLLVVGGGMRLTRQVTLAAAERERPTPSVELRSAVFVSRPTPEGDISPTSMPDRIVIPSLALDARVKPVGWTRVMNEHNAANVWETVNYAVGYHSISAPPGQPGNTVLSGHNNILGSVFKDLHKLEPEQRIYIYERGQQHAYEVETNFVVQEDGVSPEERAANAAWIEPTEDARLTIVTCYPPWSNTHRTIVIARPVDAPPLSDDASLLPVR